MVIKSIKPTNKYKHINFGDIKSNWQSARILTPNGFSKVRAFDLIKSKARTLKLELDNGMNLICDPCHKVKLSNGNSKLVKDLNKDDYLSGYNGPVKFNISDGPISDLYDIEIDKPHWYYTSGIVSHNSIMLVNTAVANSKKGKKVLYITLELSDVKSAIRALGPMTDKTINKLDLLQSNKSSIIASLNSLKNIGAGDIVFYEYPPGEISVDHITALIEHVRNIRSGWRPDVVIIDYLELLIPRQKQDGEYLIQKAVSTDIRGLAIKEKLFVITATQTNRSGNNSEEYIDVTKIGESYGKSMSMDYLVSINQTMEEYKAAIQANGGVGGIGGGIGWMHLFIAKSRGSEKFKTIDVKINYNNMTIKQPIA